MTSLRDAETQERERQEEVERLRAEVERWRARYAAAEKRDLAFVNSEGDVEPVYTPLDVEHLDATALPMLSYQHGTVYGKTEVPSFPDQSGETQLALALFAAQGYLVIGADYQLDRPDKLVVSFDNGGFEGPVRRIFRGESNVRQGIPGRDSRRTGVARRCRRAAR